MMKDIYYAVAHRSQEEIDSFKMRYEDFDDSLIPEVFKNSLGLKVIDWKPSVSWGSAHVIYFVKVKGEKKPLVLRANTGWGDPEVVMLTEKLVADKVLAVGLKTNKILHVDVSRKSFDFDFQIQEDIGGLDPEVDFPDGKKEYDQLSYELGEYVARLQEIKLPGFGRFSDEETLGGGLVGTKKSMHNYLMVNVEDDLQYLVKAEVISKKQSSGVMRVLENAKGLIDIDQGSLVHHDLADHNLRYKDGHLLAVFDWEAMVVGDESLDLASCPTWGTLHPREEKMLSGFTSIRELPQDFEKKRNIYRLRTLLWKTVYCIRANILTDPRAKRFTTALEPFGL